MLDAPVKEFGKIGERPVRSGGRAAPFYGLEHLQDLALANGRDWPAAPVPGVRSLKDAAILPGGVRAKLALDMPCYERCCQTVEGRLALHLLPLPLLGCDDAGVLAAF